MQRALPPPTRSMVGSGTGRSLPWRDRAPFWSAVKVSQARCDMTMNGWPRPLRTCWMLPQKPSTWVRVMSMISRSGPSAMATFWRCASETMLSRQSTANASPMLSMTLV